MCVVVFLFPHWFTQLGVCGLYNYDEGSLERPRPRIHVLILIKHNLPAQREKHANNDMCSQSCILLWLCLFIKSNYCYVLSALGPPVMGCSMRATLIFFLRFPYSVFTNIFSLHPKQFFGLPCSKVEVTTIPKRVVRYRWAVVLATISSNVI